MNNALLVGRFQSFRNLSRDRECLVEWNLSLRDPISERWPLNKLHYEGLDARTFFESVNLGDIRMVQGRERSGFTFEASQAFDVLCERLWQDLDGDPALKLRVARTVYLAHPARTELGSDFIRAEPSASSESHGKWLQL